MFIDTLNRVSESKISEFKFPAQELAAVLQKSEQEVLTYYECWQRKRKTRNPNFNQAFIAGLVGQSKTTVSNFINQRFQNISPQKRELLREVIEIIGYKPSQSAQLIRSKEKKYIGVLANITQTPSKDYTSGILEGIKTKANEYNYSLLIYDVIQAEQGDFVKRMPFLGLVDGIIIIGSMLEAKDYCELARHKLLVSLVSPWHTSPCEFCQTAAVASCIKADLVGLEDLFRHYKQQVKAPVLLTIGVDKYPQRKKKIDLYQKYYSQDSSVVYLDNYSVAATEKAAAQLNFANYDAFFCLADLVAICIQQYLRQQGRKALVTGYDNTNMARVLGIPTVSHNIKQQGSEAFAKLFLALSYKKINKCSPVCELSRLRSKFIEYKNE